MANLISRFGSTVKGILTGFDRIVFKGTILPLASIDGVRMFCQSNNILNKDYKAWMYGRSGELIEAVETYAANTCGRGIVPIGSSRIRKEKLAHNRQQSEEITEGLIGAWSCQEAGKSYKAQYCAKAGFPQLRHYQPRCKHLYLYFDHADFGFMNVRLQTWFPYHIQFCMNGREWLRRSLQKEGIDFIVHGNKFIHIADYKRAQELLDSQLDTCWRNMLEDFLPTVFPSMTNALGPDLSYYWTMWQSEWATDLIFDTPDSLKSILKNLLLHALMTGTAETVLRYLDRPITNAGKPFANSNNEVTTRVKQFGDGVRIRHWVDHNSVKVYNEQNILRFETTINDPKMFRVHRRVAGEPLSTPKRLLPMRKGVADVVVRTQVSNDVNKRVMDSILTFKDDTSVGELFAPIAKSKRHAKITIRALAPTGKDREILQAISSPEFDVHGMTNKQLRAKLKTTSWGAGRTEKQLSARVSRHIRLLRDHGIIRKVPSRRRYHLSKRGRQITTALNAILATSTEKLMEIAA